MSSYVASPFEIERRRLQGIVNQCRMDLEQAVKEVQDQVDKIAEAERQRAAERQRLEQELKESRKRAVEKLAKEKQEVRARKTHLMAVLENKQLELDAYERQYGGMDSAYQRQQRLVRELENAGSDLSQIEKHIKEHFRKTREEVKARSVENHAADVSLATIGVQRADKGISLQMSQEEKKKRREKPSVRDLFSHRLRAAAAVPESAGVPQLAALKEEFEAQPEYAKAAFAAKNMKKLEGYLSRISALRKKAQEERSASEKAAAEYRAACLLLNREPDEQLLEEPLDLMNLTRACEELMRIYEDRKKREYVSRALSEVMGRHGIEYADAGEQGALLFTMDSAELTVSGAGSDYLTMEIEGQYSGSSVTSNDRRKSTAAARHFCSLLPDIERELRDEFGLVFKNISTEEPDEDRIVMKRSSVRSGRRFHESVRTMTAE